MKQFTLLILFSITLANATSLDRDTKQVRSGRIINGVKAELGQFPWQVAIIYVGGEGEHFCGGSLISTEWVLTSAKCVASVPAIENFILYTGIVDLDEVHNKLAVVESIMHDDYIPRNSTNDVAVLRLSSPVTLDENTNIISLYDDEVDGGVPVTISGWGEQEAGSYLISQYLNYVEATTITNDECDESWGIGATHESFICASGSDDFIANFCRGDRGGPLVASINGNVVQVGIASHNVVFGCQTKVFPSVYNRISYYRDWIREKTGV